MSSLFDSCVIGKIATRNRFIRSAIGFNLPGGFVNDKVVEEYNQLASGGMGTIVTGYTLASSFEAGTSLMSLYDDKFIDGTKRLVEAAHAGGAKVLVQLVVLGSYTTHGIVEGVTHLGPSAVPHKNTKTVPREATVDELKQIQADFAAAAVRVKAAGFDGVQIHGAHTFLLSQFMSPRYNQRKDSYGGTPENRCRMHVETYEAIRAAVGPDFPVWIKINSNEGFEGGVSFDDVLLLCKQLAERGIDAIEVSGDFSTYKVEDGPFFTKEATTIAAAVPSVSVILTGGVRSVVETTKILREGKIQGFGIARPTVKNPAVVNDWAKEWEEKGKKELDG